MTAAALHAEGYREIGSGEDGADTGATFTAEVRGVWRSLGRTGQAVIVAALFVAAFGMMLSSAAQASGVSCASQATLAWTETGLLPPAA